MPQNEWNWTSSVENWAMTWRKGSLSLVISSPGAEWTPPPRNVINGKVSWEGSTSTSQMVQLQFLMDAKRVFTVSNLGSLGINDLFSQIFTVRFFPKFDHYNSHIQILMFVCSLFEKFSMKKRLLNFIKLLLRSKEID